MTLITLDNVGKVYMDGGGVPVPALNEITFRLDQGDFICLAGPSGSGKTTLLNIIGCLDRPTTGKVTVTGRTTSTMSRTELAAIRRLTFGFIFQSYNLIPVLTAYENVEFILQLQGIDRNERRKQVTRVLGDVGLAGLADKRPAQLSGGQQQRVAVARALVGKPSLVLADEPTANLDSTTARELIDLLWQLNSESGTSFLFSSHDPAVISRAQRVISMKDGRLE